MAHRSHRHTIKDVYKRQGLTVADDLGAYAFGTDTLVPMTYVAYTVRYYSNGILQTTPAVTAGPPLSVSGISVPAGGNVTIV